MIRSLRYSTFTTLTGHNRKARLSALATRPAGSKLLTDPRRNRWRFRRRKRRRAHRDYRDHQHHRSKKKISSQTIDHRKHHQDHRQDYPPLKIRAATEPPAEASWMNRRPRT